MKVCPIVEMFLPFPYFIYSFFCRYNELQEISELINDLKIENYNYFLNIKPEPEVSEDEPDTDEDEIMEAQVKEDEAEYTKEELERIAEETVFKLIILFYSKERVKKIFIS